MVATAGKTVFLLGAGFVGQHVIEFLLESKYAVTTIVRKEEIAAKLEKAGVKAILGTLDDHELITSQVAEHEVTINTSSSDDLPSVQAILAGVRKRVVQDLPITFIHTSGAGVMIDDARGRYKTDKVYRDDDPADIDALPPTAIHRDVDLAIVEAAREFGAKARVAIVIPPVVYGFNSNHNRLSMALPVLVKFALKHGFSGRVGEGRNVWGSVHVADLGRVYPTLVEHLGSEPSSALVENPYFFAENGTEFSWKEAAEKIGQILYKLGKIPSPETKAWEPSDLKHVIGPATEIYFGGNSRSVGTRLPKMGWVPREKDIWASLEEDEIPYMIATQI
ncbi:NAD(P)-binding protein [Pleomassaria siparia CBS 279.74]|uniref:NAD(P)-binding protein n=1 Tax=Pleomassaria siparia CBS 279.74 TaxID=1314801 RepID=A0A6G1KQ56_9PLEO|nr:NAD(P)-binding protein [Pleomassaria siparia CBS 279.74]